jgi:hypothetical protein
MMELTPLKIHPNDQEGGGLSSEVYLTVRVIPQVSWNRSSLSARLRKGVRKDALFLF